MKNNRIYPWILVGLLWGVALLNYMDRQMLSTMKEACKWISRRLSLRRTLVV